jgi:hypothetical protein
MVHEGDEGTYMESSVLGLDPDDLVVEPAKEYLRSRFKNDQGVKPRSFTFRTVPVMISSEYTSGTGNSETAIGKKTGLRDAKFRITVRLHDFADPPQEQNILSTYPHVFEHHTIMYNFIIKLVDNAIEECWKMAKANNGRFTNIFNNACDQALNMYAARKQLELFDPVLIRNHVKKYPPTPEDNQYIEDRKKGAFFALMAKPYVIEDDDKKRMSITFGRRVFRYRKGSGKNAQEGGTSKPQQGASGNTQQEVAKRFAAALGGENGNGDASDANASNPAATGGAARVANNKIDDLDYNPISVRVGKTGAIVPPRADRKSLLHRGMYCEFPLELEVYNTQLGSGVRFVLHTFRDVIAVYGGHIAGRSRDTTLTFGDSEEEMFANTPYWIHEECREEEGAEGEENTDVGATNGNVDPQLHGLNEKGDDASAEEKQQHAKKRRNPQLHAHFQSPALPVAAAAVPKGVPVPQKKQKIAAPSSNAEEDLSKYAAPQKRAPRPQKLTPPPPPSPDVEDNENEGVGEDEGGDDMDTTQQGEEDVEEGVEGNGGVPDGEDGEAQEEYQDGEEGDGVDDSEATQQ